MDNEKINDLQTEFISKYKILASDSVNHPKLIKNIEFLQYLAIVLGDSNETIVLEALKTLQLLIHNQANLFVMSTTFGIIEAVKCITQRCVETDNLWHLANAILKELTSPAYSTRSQKNNATHYSSQLQKVSRVFTFYINGLCMANRSTIEETLVKVKGLVSLQLDVDRQTCTVRVFNNITPKSLAKVIAINTKLEAKLVMQNKLNKEITVSVLSDEDKVNDLGLPPYLPEQESPVRDKAVSILGSLRANASGVVHWFQQSFYW